MLHLVLQEEGKPTTFVVHPIATPQCIMYSQPTVQIQRKERVTVKQTAESATGSLYSNIWSPYGALNNRTERQGDRHTSDMSLSVLEKYHSTWHAVNRRGTADVEQNCSRT